MGGKVHISFDLTGTFHVLSIALHFQNCYLNRGGERGVGEEKMQREQDRFPQSDKNKELASTWGGCFL